MVWVLNGGLKTEQKISVCGLKRLVLKWSPNPAIWKLGKKVSEKSNIQISGDLYSDGYCTVGAQILNMLRFLMVKSCLNVNGSDFEWYSKTEQPTTWNTTK